MKIPDMPPHILFSDTEYSNSISHAGKILNFVHAELRPREAQQKTAELELFIGAHRYIVGLFAAYTFRRLGGVPVGYMWNDVAFQANQAVAEDAEHYTGSLTRLEVAEMVGTIVARVTVPPGQPIAGSEALAIGSMAQVLYGQFENR